jgi:hypothetical protein
MAGDDDDVAKLYDDEPEELQGRTKLSEDLRLAPRPGQTSWLLVVGGKQCVGMLIELRPKMIIGRAQPVDVVLDEEGVSRRHARIDVLAGGVVRVSDLESSNGIRIDGRRVKLHVLRDGERLRLGEAVLTLVHLDDNREALARNLRASADALGPK